MKKILPRARKHDLLVKELRDETLVYDLETNDAHCLNRTAALVWARCDGKTTAARMASLLQKELDPTVDEDLVWLAIAQLQRFRLIEKDESSFVPRVSRRDLVLKYAPAALALPVILSIRAPTAAQAATTPPDPCIANPRADGCPCQGDADCDSANCNGGVCGPPLKPSPDSKSHP